MGKLSPIVSEFDSAEDEQAYQLWLEAKANASIVDDTVEIVSVLHARQRYP